MLTCLLSSLHLLYELIASICFMKPMSQELRQILAIVDFSEVLVQYTSKTLGACHCAVAVCKVRLGTLGGGKPRFWETRKAVGMPVMNE